MNELSAINLFGNNYFELKTVDTVKNKDKKIINVKERKINGVLTALPTLNWERTLVKSLAYTATNTLASLLDSPLIKVISVVADKNLNVQFTGGLTYKELGVATFQESGLTLEFETWQDNSLVYINTGSKISNYTEVLDYLTSYATVYSGQPRTVTGGSLEDLEGESKSKSASSASGDKKKEDDEGSIFDKGISWLKDRAEKIFSGDVSNKRMLNANEDFNEYLHTLTIYDRSSLRVNIIVAIKSWSVSYIKESLGNKAKVKIECVPDQRIISTTLNSDLNNPPTL